MTRLARMVVLWIDVISALVLVAWVGGQAALGAFAARIVFSELPRADAARTMTRVFHEFDWLVLIGIGVLAVCALIGLFVRGFSTLSQVRAGLELGLCALGLFEVFWVHAHIEAMFHAGQTLAPSFAVLHHLSERCAHVELLLLIAIFAVRAWPQTPASREL